MTLAVKTAIPAQEVVTQDEATNRVYATLREFKAMPLLEIAALTDMDDKVVMKIVKSLAAQSIVKVSDLQNAINAVVTLS